MATKKVLFIDDEADPNPTQFVPGNYLSYYERALTEAGYELVVAQTDTEAIMLVKSDKFHAFVLDLHFKVEKSESAFRPQPDEYAGILFALWYEKEKFQIESKAKIVVFSNVSDSEVQSKLSKLKCISCVLSKHDCLPDELVVAVEGAASH